MERVPFVTYFNMLTNLSLSLSPVFLSLLVSLSLFLSLSLSVCLSLSFCVSLSLCDNISSTHFTGYVSFFTPFLSSYYFSFFHSVFDALKQLHYYFFWFLIFFYFFLWSKQALEKEAAARSKKPKEFDPTTPSGVELLCEMSIAEMEERVQVCFFSFFLFLQRKTQNV